ncbi:hypothetical protein B0H14DRAFT_2664035 [Mycena olivaceomarginata]|nr:hypothetical protein B0H14DRAFT_2664035 [Mycena olivaceomarginata]
MHARALERHVALMDFLDTVRIFSESNPEFGNGLHEHRDDFKEQVRFLANTIERQPSLFPHESQDAPTSDSLLVEAGSGTLSIDDDLDNESGFLDEFLTDLNVASVKSAAASPLGTHESAPLESSPGRLPTLFPGAIDAPFSFPFPPDTSVDSLDFDDASIMAEIGDSDSSILGARENTLHQAPRAIELVMPSSRLREIVYLADMSSRLYNFLRAEGAREDDLAQIQHTPELFERLNAGSILANCSKEIQSEADVEHAFKVSQGHIRFGLHHQDRYYPHNGTPGSQAGRSSHAITDVEIPAFLGLEDRVVEELVDRFPGVGLKFGFSYPQSFRDTLDSTVQPVVQIWTQLNEKAYNFGQGSSHEFSFFAVRDPETPQRLYISRCHPALFDSASPSRITPSPTESGLYTMFNLFRIASKSEYSDRFLQKLRNEMNNPEKLISVHCRDITLAGKFEPTRNHVPTVDLSKGTVGVTYYDQPNNKETVTRKGPSVDYKDLSGSRIDESLVQNLKPPSKIPVPKQPPGKTTQARKIKLQFQNRPQAVPNQTGGTGMKPSRARQSTQASRQRAVRTTSSGEGSSRPTTRNAAKAEPSPIEVKQPKGSKTHERTKR